MTSNCAKNTENQYTIDALTLYTLHTLIIHDIWYCDNLTIWLTFWQFDILIFWHFDILTFWHFYNFTWLTISHCWQFYIVDNFTLLTLLTFGDFDIFTFWQIENLKIWHFTYDNLTLLTIWHCWQFGVVDNLTLLTTWYCWQLDIVDNLTCWQFDIVDNLALLTIWHCWHLTLLTFYIDDIWHLTFSTINAKRFEMCIFVKYCNLKQMSESLVNNMDLRDASASKK